MFLARRSIPGWKQRPANYRDGRATKSGGWRVDSLSGDGAEDSLCNAGLLTSFLFVCRTLVMPAARELTVETLRTADISRRLNDRVTTEDVSNMSSRKLIMQRRCELLLRHLEMERGCSKGRLSC